MVVPLVQPLYGVVLAMLTLAKGVRFAAVTAGLVGAVLVLVNTVTGADFAAVVAAVVVRAVPILILAGIFNATRSLTLMMQAMAILAVAGSLALGGYIAGYPDAWQTYVATSLETMRQIGFNAVADGLAANPDFVARWLQVTLVSGVWLLMAATLLFGHRWHQLLEGNERRYGRFCDLNFGRVIALGFVVMSAFAFLAGIEFLENAAIVLFNVFLLQSLALLHWFCAVKNLPPVALAGLYVALFLVSWVVPVLPFVVGYLDALFNFRRLWVKAERLEK